MITTFQVKSYLTYWLDAVDEHSLHSPFFFDFHKNVIKRHAAFNNTDIELLRKKLLTDHSVLEIRDHGAGSKALNGTRRKLSDIAGTSLSSQKFSMLYQRAVEFYHAKNVIELGTSLGINTLYLAKNPETRVTTFEGSPEIAASARANFQCLQASNITLKEGNIDKALPAFLDQTGRIDLAFFDANHRYEPTLRYFSWILPKLHAQSILILDDIHYSEQMDRAWKELKKHPVVYGSADFYRCGFLFFNPSLNKQHVVLQF
jgi:predicted O-methyltransferase YrrM